MPTKSLVCVNFLGLPPAIISEQVVNELVSSFRRLVFHYFNFTCLECLDVVLCLVSVPLGTRRQDSILSISNSKVKIQTNFKQAISCQNCMDDTRKSVAESLINDFEIEQCSITSPCLITNNVPCDTAPTISVDCSIVPETSTATLNASLVPILTSFFQHASSISRMV